MQFLYAKMCIMVKKNSHSSSKGRPGNFYFHSFFSYVLILLIPVLLALFFYMFRYSERFKMEVDETITLSLERFSSQMETQLENTRRIALQTPLSGVLDGAMQPTSILDYKNSMGALSLITMADSFVRETLFIPTNGQYAILPYSTVTKDFMYRREIAVEGYSEERLKQILTGDSPYIFPYVPIVFFSPSYDVERAMWVVQPVQRYGKLCGSLSFIIPHESIEVLIGEKLRKYEAEVAILDSNTGNLIFSSFKDGILTSEMLSDIDNGIMIGDIKHNVYMDQPEIGGRIYYAFIRSGFTFEQIKHLNSEFFLSIILTVIFSLIAIYFVNRIMYRNIDDLNKKAKRIAGTYASSSEINNVATALDRLSAVNATLYESIRKSRNVVLDYKVNALLEGAYESVAEFNEECSSLGLLLREGIFSVASIDMGASLASMDVLLSILSEIETPIRMYVTCHRIQGEAVIIFNYDKGMEDTINAILENIMWYGEKADLELTIGFSTEKNRITDIPSLYIEAHDALDWKFIKGRLTIIRKKDIENYASTANNLSEALDEFTLSAKFKDTQRLYESFQSLMDGLIVGGTSLYIARNIVFEAVETLSRTYVGCTLIKDIDDKCTIFDIEKMVKSFLQTVIEQENREKEKHSVGAMVQYIEENYSDINFSVGNMAGHFNMNMSAMSKYFHEKTDITIQEELIKLRMKDAGELLETTTLPVSEIAEKVGYANLTSFSRRFKIYFDCSPGEYRKGASSGKRK